MTPRTPSNNNEVLKIIKMFSISVFVIEHLLRSVERLVNNVESVKKAPKQNVNCAEEAKQHPIMCITTDNVTFYNYHSGTSPRQPCLMMQSQVLASDATKHKHLATMLTARTSAIPRIMTTFKL